MQSLSLPGIPPMYTSREYPYKAKTNLRHVQYAACNHANILLATQTHRNIVTSRAGIVDSSYAGHFSWYTLLDTLP